MDREKLALAASSPPSMRSTFPPMEEVLSRISVTFLV